MFRNIAKSLALTSPVMTAMYREQMGPTTLSDSVGSDEARQQLHQLTSESKQSYSRAVFGVNSLLMRAGIPLEKNDFEFVSNTVRKVESGALKSPLGHLEEVKGFGKSAINSAINRDFANAGIKAAGAFGNMIAFSLTAGQHHTYKRH